MEAFIRYETVLTDGGGGRVTRGSEVSLRRVRQGTGPCGKFDVEFRVEGDLRGIEIPRSVKRVGNSVGISVR